MLYLENYGPYAELVQKRRMVIDVNSITINNWQMHFDSVLNIMRDAIETDLMNNAFITIQFAPGIDCELTVPDYWFNILMWYLLVRTNKRIEPRHIFFNENMTRRDIKNYVDEFFIEENRTSYENIELNNIIDDCLTEFNRIDEFAFFLANTINLEDFIDLMNNVPRFDQLIHSDLSNVPLDEVKSEGLKLTDEAISIIKNSEHCLSNFFRAGEGVNKKQFKEFAINTGTKPDGNGGAFPVVVNTNLLTGGANDTASFLIESATGRTAQTIVEGNVGPSGYFARLLGLNATDTFINPNPNYICNTKNFQIIEIKNDLILNKFENRYYRLNPNGVEYKLTKKDRHLIGKTLYFRSPMTCASMAEGHGICYRCYGDLAHTNKDIAIGKMSSEILASVFTQMMLSAKHLLESSIKSMTWNKEFGDLFEVEFNFVKLNSDFDFSGYKILMDADSITPDSEDEDQLQCDFNEHVTSFDVLFPNGVIVNMHTAELDLIYLTPEITEYIRETATKLDGKITIDLGKLSEFDVPLFALKIQNDDMSKALERVKNKFDKVDTIKQEDRNSLLQSLMEVVIDIGLDILSVHCEVLLAMQLRNVDDILDLPQWQYPDEPYKMLTLRQSLDKHPSVTISLSFEKIGKLLYNPLTFRKNKASFMDLFFMEQPQMYLANKAEIQKSKADDFGMKKMIYFKEPEELNTVDIDDLDDLDIVEEI